METEAKAADAVLTSGAQASSSSSSTAPENAAAAAEGKGRPESYLLLFNVGKRQNFGTLLRSACAFGVSEVLVVGAKKLATFGNQGTAGFTPERHIETLEAAKEHCKSRGIRICGIEIDDNAKPIQDHPFAGPTAFMLGNEGIGMSQQQREACDFFVYIPQHSGATASLNVAVAGSIVLHHFALWAGMPEHAREGEKYVLDPRRHKLERFRNPTEAEKEEIERKRLERAAKRSRADGEEAAEPGLDDADDALDEEG